MKRTRGRFVVMASLAAACLAVSANAWGANPSQPVRAALVKGCNDGRAQETGTFLDPFLPDMRELFGYERFEIVASDRRSLPCGEESWLIPTRGFYLKIFSLDPEGDTLRAYAELYRGEEFLLQFRFELADGQPLFIRGPEWGSCQLVVVLMREDGGGTAKVER